MATAIMSNYTESILGRKCNQIKDIKSVGGWHPKSTPQEHASKVRVILPDEKTVRTLRKEERRMDQW